jgi:hypothetical protein
VSDSTSTEDSGHQVVHTTSEVAADEAAARVRDRARHFVYERLAILSAVIWALGTLILFIAIVPFVPRPQPFIMVAMTVPLIPAAIPWLFYGAISSAVARRWLARDQSGASG